MTRNCLPKTPWISYPFFSTDRSADTSIRSKSVWVIEIADGSRRRKAAALTESDYRVLVGELDDEQMAALSRLGNDYRPTSAYERGQRYASRLQNEFAGNISALADAENISRKIITRCINTAKLPKSVVALFLIPVNYLPGQVMHFKELLQIKKNYLSSRHLTFTSRKKQE
ncbi:ParB/RepB/Spo0J family partition protein [Escherichia coli]|uniref:ParB/RepB/Spo0J family partition protein n=1 Tax=Escherichia coli TaxID=562 RepID=UPI003D651201